MAHQFSSPSGLAGGARALALQYRAELLDAPGRSGLDIYDALEALADTCAAIPTAQAKGATILNDPRLNQATSSAEARSVVGGALSAARSALATYKSALDAAQSQLGTALRPKLPAGTDGALVAFRAEELVKRLEGARSGLGVISVATTLLADALATGDALKVYLLAGGVVLTDAYGRMGVDMAKLTSAFGQVMAQAAGTNGAGKGAALLSLLSRGGPETLRGFADWCAATLASEQKNYDASVSSYVAIGGARSYQGV